jgi:hypothetical protein
MPEGRGLHRARRVPGQHLRCAGARRGVAGRRIPRGRRHLCRRARRSPELRHVRSRVPSRAALRLRRVRDERRLPRHRVPGTADILRHDHGGLQDRLRFGQLLRHRAPLRHVHACLPGRAGELPHQRMPGRTSLRHDVHDVPRRLLDGRRLPVRRDMHERQLRDPAAPLPRRTLPGRTLLRSLYAAVCPRLRRWNSLQRRRCLRSCHAHVRQSAFGRELRDEWLSHQPRIL